MNNATDKYLYWIALGKVQNVGPVLTRRLLQSFKDPENIFAASKKQLMQVPDIGEKTADSILCGPDLDYARRQVEIAEKKNFRLITYDSTEYPARLKQIYDPPHILYVMGEFSDEDNRAVGVVGSRHATHYGKSMAETVAAQLALAGVTVVSGLARGIDSSAHRAAIATGGRTVAVLGCGLDVIYPPENASLYEDISHHGAVVSELPFGTPPEGPNFPRRNRIISGLSLGVVIVEAGKRSGALVTANHALEQNREVFAIPGNITSMTSSGTNALIKQGAKLVTSADDVLSELQFMLPDGRTPEPAPSYDLDPEQSRLFELIDDEPLHVDILSRRSGVEVRHLLGVLLEMELKGAVTQVAGKKFVKSGVQQYNR